MEYTGLPRRAIQEVPGYRAFSGEESWHLGHRAAAMGAFNCWLVVCTSQPADTAKFGTKLSSHPALALWSRYALLSTALVFREDTFNTLDLSAHSSFTSKHFM